MGKGIVKLGEGQWAVKDGNLLAAKETNGRFKNAEFTVTRGSDATYVGRDGLIKQTSSNIELEVFLNPNFDTTIPLGNAGSGWSDDGVGEVAFYNGGLKMTTDGSGTAKARARDASLSSAILETSRLYELTYEIKSISSKSNALSLYAAGNTITITQKSVGTHTILIASGTNANKIFQFQWTQVDGESIVLGNVSLKESLVINGSFDADSDWSKSNSTISGGKGNLDGDGQIALLWQDILTNGKTYKATFTVSDYNDSGTAKVINNSASITYYTITGNGTFTIYFRHSDASGNFLFRAKDGAVLSIDNVSVFEINNGALPRIDFTDNTDGHLLLEPQSTNLLTYSEDFSEWSPTNATTTQNVVTSPDGTVNANKIIATSTTSQHRINFTSSNASGSTTFSFFAKSAEYNSCWARIGLDSGFFDLENGLTSANVGITPNIVDYGNGWYKCSITKASSNANEVCRINITTSYTTTADFLGDNTSGIYVYGAQHEQLSHPTSYIPTNGSTVTRDAETCTGAGETADFNSEEGVLYAEISALTDNQSYRYITLSDGTNGNYIVIRYYNIANKIAAFIENTSGVQGSTSHSFSPSETITDFHKVAYKWKANDFALWIDGTEVSTQSSGTTFSANVLNKLQFNEGDGSGNDFYGKCKAIRVYKEALSDTDLENLTS